MLNTPVGIDTLHLNPKGWRLDKDFTATVTSAPFHSGDGHRERGVAREP